MEVNQVCAREAFFHKVTANLQKQCAQDQQLNSDTDRLMGLEGKTRV